MALLEILTERQATIREKWLDRIRRTYPDETFLLLKNKKSQFGNPVGHAINGMVEDIVSRLLSDEDTLDLSDHTKEFIKIRAVQEFKSKEAIGFIFFLKDVLREVTGDALKDNLDELFVLYSRIDQLALSVFDTYMENREKMYDIKSNELRMRTVRLLEYSKYSKRVDS